MPATASPPTIAPPSPPGWRLSWLTPPLCRLGLLLLLLLQILPRYLYLHSPSAIDLAPDEAQYWVWGQHLDWSYYSKGPMVALLIRASTSLLGDTPFGVRFPAILIGVLVSLLTYFFTRRLFASEKLALGAVAINYFVPMFIAGSMIMTIDPPFVLFWAGATACFMLAIVEGRRWAWPLAGLLVGLSFLAKYAALVLFAGIVLGLLMDKTWRRKLLQPGLWLSFAIALLCTTPVLYWNYLHHWVTAKHVGADTTKGFNPMEPVAFLLGTIVVVGPALAVIIAAAAWKAVKWGKSEVAAQAADVPVEHARRARFLVMTVLPYLVMIVASSFTTNAKINWSAPVWFALLIVAVWFLGIQLRSIQTWKPWRGWFWATILFALVITPFAHDMPRLYPALAWVQTHILHRRVRTLEYELTRLTIPADERKKEISIRVWDPTARLRGWKELGQDLATRQAAMPNGQAFFLVDDYSEAAALEFYLPGHPRTYTMGTYIEDPKHRGRASQWDIWPERSVEKGKTLLTGQNAIYMGPPYQAVRDAFDRVEELPDHRIILPVNGVNYYLGGYKVYACYGFKGFTVPNDGKKAW